MLKELHVSRVVHFSDFLIVRLVGGDVGGVFGVAVAVDGGDANLLFGIGAHQAVLGIHLHAHHGGVSLFAARHTHGHPASNQVEIVAVRIKPRATTVGQDSRTLKEQETVRRGRRAQSPTAALFH